MTIAVIALGLALIAQSTALVFLVLKILQGSSTEATRLSTFASEALNAQLAKSLQEKAQVEAAKETHQMQVAYMADQLAKSKKQNGKAQPNQTHK